MKFTPLGLLFFFPFLCFVLVWVYLGVWGLPRPLVELGVCSSVLKFPAECLFARLTRHWKLKLDKPWTLGISHPCWTTYFWAGARSKSQLYSKARGLHLEMDFGSHLCLIFPNSSVSYPVLLCGCSDRQDGDFVIRSLPSYGVPAAFRCQLSSWGSGIFAFTMLHTALNCVEKARCCFPLAFCQPRE